MQIIQTLTFAFYLIFSLVCCAHDNEVELSKVFLIGKWHSVSPAKKIKTNINDPWLPGKAFGIAWEKESSPLKEESLKSIRRLLDSAKCDFETIAPWDGAETVSAVILNTKKCPVWHLELPAAGNGTIKIKQVLKIRDQEKMARFAFGDENLIYAELDSPELLKAIRLLLTLSPTDTHD